ncbi:MAG: MoxR family ATPase [Acidobacteriota bacterium]
MSAPGSIGELRESLADAGYFADDDLATSLFLGLRLARPVLLEGEPGVGKTAVAKVLSEVLERPLLRLQCYEGLDLASALYEWDYARQLLHIRLAEAAGEGDREGLRREIFAPEFLLRRPLLEAIDPPSGVAPILLIDELDRADEEFEAFLLEVLAEHQVTIPELGTVRAAQPPAVVLTSNRSRDLADALRRRCLFQWLDYPDFERELRIVEHRVPDAATALATQVVAVVQELRQRDLVKRPGVAETLDWASALVALDQRRVTVETFDRTLGSLLKYREDQATVRQQGLERMIAAAR